MKRKISEALPLPLLKVIRAMRTTLTHTRWKLTFLAARLAGRHGVVSFFPGFPSPNAAIYKICAVNGWSMRRSRKAGLSFFWPLDESTAPAILPDLTNGCCININKSNVAQHFEQSFGFTYVVDPLTHFGPYVRKSDENAKHDGVVMNAPSDPIQGMFYQVLINNSISDNEVEDIRLVYVRGIIGFLYRKVRPINSRFSNKNTYVTLVQLEELVSSDEIHRIGNMCESIGLEYGEIDCLRNRSDSNLYVIDINRTPFGPPNGLSPPDAAKALDLMAEAFRARFPMAGT